MQISDYPLQEPLSDAGRAYGEECLRRGVGVHGDESRYGDDPYQSVLVHRAANPDGRVLLFWHGGGWTSGYKEWMSFMAPAFTAVGVTFVTAGYRLAPGHLFPAGLEDCVGAVRWTLANAPRFGGDPHKLFLGGHSAGGHYAALLAVKRDWQAKAGVPVACVRGCLPLSGVYDFTASSGLTMRPRFLGASGNEREASPIHQLEAPLPPFYVAHGSNDFPHLMKQAEAFEAAYGAAGGSIQRDVLQGRNHFSASYAGGEADGPWVKPALAFMASALR